MNNNLTACDRPRIGDKDPSGLCLCYVTYPTCRRHGHRTEGSFIWSNVSRKTIGKRQRFEIFKRDGFTCQYCGAKPPDVTLVVDHINPISQGGDNDELNLITSCESCNQGKSDKTLNRISPKPDADLEWLEMQQEIVEMRRYQLAKATRDSLEKQIVTTLQETWSVCMNDSRYTVADHIFIQWLSWATPDEIEEAIKIGASKSYRIIGFNDRLKYVAGVLHNITGTKAQ